MLMLTLILAGVAGLVYATSRSGAASALPDPRPSGPDVETGSPEPVAELILRLPEPARARAWALLCTVTDALRGGAADPRTQFLLTQTRGAYLPDTLRAYLDLGAAARATLERQGQRPETLLDEQLSLMDEGVSEALRHDHAAADRLLTQGRFLRERFGSAAGAEAELRARPR